MPRLKYFSIHCNHHLMYRLRSNLKSKCGDECPVIYSENNYWNYKKIKERSRLEQERRATTKYLKAKNSKYQNRQK